MKHWLELKLLLEKWILIDRSSGLKSSGWRVDDDDDVENKRILKYYHILDSNYILFIYCL